MNKFNKSA